MSQKRSTAKGSSPPTASKASGDESLRQLASHLSAVINHPEAPVEMVNRIIEAFGEIEADISNNHSADFIAVVLKEHLEAGDEAPDAPQSVFAGAAATVADLLEANDTPEVLRTALQEVCVELSNQVSEPGECVCSPETTRRHLPAILERAEAAGLRCGAGMIFESSGGAGKGAR